LARAIKVEPTQEPVELSFFEAECLPQLPDHRPVVAGWRQSFKGISALLATGDAPQQASPGDNTGVTQEPTTGAVLDTGLIVPPDGGLSQWNADGVAEEQRYRAKIEETRRAAAMGKRRSAGPRTSLLIRQLQRKQLSRHPPFRRVSTRLSVTGTTRSCYPRSQSQGSSFTTPATGSTCWTS
jgi:hypothetical protein